ncbi:hypothetical protein GF327_06900 [Candidatus Woesearchaeota archaeon]|nr:hypothetical protein [Candidatus Woesearchaeota archaeon]
MKKAQLEITMARVIALVLLVFFLIFGVTILPRIFNEKLDEEMIDQLCFQSILLNAEKRIPVAGTETVKSKCVTKYITIHPTGAEQKFEANPLDDTRGGESVKLGKIPFRKDLSGKKCSEIEGNPGIINGEKEEACLFQNINKRISYEMFRCWTNFHKGKRRVFSLYRDDTQCIVCSVIRFDNEIRSKYKNWGPVGIYMAGDEDKYEQYSLDHYMKTNSDLKSAAKTYYEYTLDIVDKVYQPPYYDYDVSNDYAVVFVALNKEATNMIADKLWEEIKNLLGDDAPDEEEGNYVNRIEFVPNHEVPMLCGDFV